MNIIKKTKKIFRRLIVKIFGSDFINSLSNDRWHIDFLKHGLTKACTLDGIDYYVFNDPLHMPYRRFAVATDYVADMQMKITPEEYKLVMEGLKEMLINGKVADARVVVDDLLVRGRWEFDLFSLMKLATVFYVTDKEDPTDFDFDYNSKKLEVFIRNSDFFLPLALKDLIPLWDLSARDTLIYSIGKIIESKRTLTRIQLSDISTELRSRIELELLTRDAVLVHLQQLLNGLPH